MNDLVILLYAIIDAIWSFPAVLALLSTGAYLTFMTKGVQIRRFMEALKLLFQNKKQSTKSAEGNISPYQALSVSLAGTVGVGNIGAVAAAIAVGGPGAVFWMWVTAALGMAMAYSCCTLSIKFREKNEEGEYVGGPMYVLKKALNMPKLAIAFAIFTIFASMGSGNMMSSNMMFQGINYMVPGSDEYLFWMSVITAALVAAVILGGIKRIAHMTSVVVPFMCLAYLLAAIYVLATNLSAIPSAFFTIFNYALNPWAAGGGALGAAMQFGVARGLFSNEAGQGTIAIAHAAAKTNDPEKQGLIAMLGPFIDTLIICTMTALVIIVMGVWGENVGEDIEGTKLAVHAFSQAMGSMGGWIVAISMLFFSFSTIVSWSYYGEAAINYLIKKKKTQAVFSYRVFYIAMVVVGAGLNIEAAWKLTDLVMVCMMAPNLVALWLLVKLVRYIKNTV